MGEPPMGRYRLRATMTPLHGQPVNWNARAIIWGGSDHRYWLRRGVVTITRWAKPWPAVWSWLRRLTDDRRNCRYTATQGRLRRLLNTEADIQAREAWAETNRYWRSREAAKRRRSTLGSTDGNG